MPFITKDRREAIERRGLAACQDFGDPCFVFYKQMVEEWKKEPRWSTAHVLYRELIEDDSDLFMDVCAVLAYKFDPIDVKCAAKLAWQVFWDRYVLPYENEKEKLNGTI
jgi:hypothetical protein